MKILLVNPNIVKIS